MLKINEVYGPVQQGEGKSSGKEVMFIRLSMCNLHCDWCDTPYTWNWIGTSFKHQQKFDRVKETHEMSATDVLRQLKEKSATTSSVVISGGEPMIQQKELVGLLTMLKHMQYWIEIETNGTIAPTVKFLSLVDQINCSPKISNSGNTAHERERPVALRTLSGFCGTNFKFVVSCREDVGEILALVQNYNMKEVYLMPEGRTREEIQNHELIVDQLCSQFGFKKTTRLHILEHGNKRAV